MWKKVGSFAHCEIWAKGNKRTLVNPKTNVVEFEYKEENPNQLKIPFRDNNYFYQTKVRRKPK